MKDQNRRYCCHCNKWVFSIVPTGEKGLLGEDILRIEKRTDYRLAKPKHGTKSGYYCLECYNKLNYD